MIHTIFNLTRPLFLLDAETTGTNIEKDRIIELAFEQYTSEGLIKEWVCRFNPGISVESSEKIHGISDSMLFSCPRFSAYAESLARGFRECDFGGKNIRFDLGILGREFARVGIDWGYADARIIDADRLEQLGEPRTLSDLYRKHVRVPCGCTSGCPACGGLGSVPADPSGAHGAKADVRMTGEILVAQLEKYKTLPRGLDDLHELQWPGRIDTEGKFRFVEGVPTVWFGKYRGQPMVEVERDYWQYILRKDFSMETKRIAAAALRGEFPRQVEDAGI